MKSQKEKLPKEKRKFTKKEIIIYAAIAAVALGSGFGVGFYLHSVLKPTIIVLTGDADKYRADMSVALANYEKAKATRNFVNTMTPDELVNVAFYLFGQKPTPKSTSVGYTQASTLGLSIRQSILDTNIKGADGRHFEESCSEGMINFYFRMYSEDGITQRYWVHDKPKDFTRTDLDQPARMTDDEYREFVGNYISSALRYIVSDKTLLYDKVTPSGEPSTVARVDGDKIIVELELDKDKSTMDYGKQMRAYSDLVAVPTFDYVHLRVFMDLDLNLIRMESHEAYFAMTNSGIGSPLEGFLNTVYYPDSTEPIPSLTDPITYPESI